MDPDKFRESRQEINKVFHQINTLIENHDLDGSKEGFEEINAKLDKLTPLSEGEIQKRSVKNLSIKIKSLSIAIAKLKPKKKKRIGPVPDPIIWDEARVGQLSEAFLKKILVNTSDDPDATIALSATGKGIRPSYQINFSNKDATAFSGSGHTPLKKLLPTGKDKISDPISLETIKAILKK